MSGKIESGSLKECEDSFRKWIVLARKDIATASTRKSFLVDSIDITSSKSMDNNTTNNNNIDEKRTLPIKRSSSGNLVLVKSEPSTDKSKALLSFFPTSYYMAVKVIGAILLVALLTYAMGMWPFSM